MERIRELSVKCFTFYLHLFPFPMCCVELENKNKQIRDEYTRRNVELMDENERLSTENKRIKDELDQGTCAKLDEQNARIAELERSLANAKHRRDALRSKYE